MSTRDLFDKKNKILANKSQFEVGSQAESSGNVNQTIKEKDRFLPTVNYTYPQNFARYGKAEKYYTDSFSRIYNYYPYDGSWKDRVEFRNESSYLDLYLLDNKYPRSTGYARISPAGWGTLAATSSVGASMCGLSDNLEYIQIFGGPHEAPAEYINDSLQKQFEHANVYDPAANRESNLKFDFSEGVTVETWIKKDAMVATGSTGIETIFNLTNADNGSGSLMILLDTDKTGPSQYPLYLIWTSGSDYGYLEGADTTSIAGSEFTDGEWHHLAISFKNTGSDVRVRQYWDGAIRYDGIQNPSSSNPAIGDVTGSLIANIGAMRKNHMPLIGFSASVDGYGKLSGSLDEFRYWKTERTVDQIGKYWWTQFGGGTNTDESNSDLGVYFKFNEGITGTSSVDSVVLDYSGRISNGEWTGYTQTARSTNSAIDGYFGKESEFKDPIIYSFNPRVVATLSPLVATGSSYDLANNSSIYNSIPSWITEEDEAGGNDLLHLTQIMGSYFDTLHLQIEALPRLKDKVYTDPAIYKPKTFSSRLLESQGFVTPEIFADADVMNQILNRDTTQKFDLDLTDVKNTIYQNVYNNLVHIFKSKGTEKAFRNVIRCFGVDERLIRLNIYGNNVNYELKDNYRNTVVKKRCADFNDPDRFYATIYQQTQSGNPNSVSFITASGPPHYAKEGHTSFTLESEILFPKKREVSDLNYFDIDFQTSSLFGFHSADSSDSTDFTWPANDYNMSVYAIREKPNSSNVKFMLTSTALLTGFSVESAFYENVYDNQKWNFAVRVKPKQGFSGAVSGTLATDARFDIEFYGVHSDAGVVMDEFLLTSSYDGWQPANYLSRPKRIYAACHRTNFTGSILEKTDVNIASVRYWASYLDNDTIKIHARDPSNYGSMAPYKSTYPFVPALTVPESAGIRVPQVATLALDWNFTTVTSSDAGVAGPSLSDAGYTVPDFSSGSIDQIDRYGYFSAITNLQHTGRGDFYLPNDTGATTIKYIYAGKQVAPEVIQSSDAISALGESDLYFDRDSRPVNFTYMVEKSMYQTITDEMLNIFSTITDFNNLIGEPVNKYRPNYKNMEKLRQLFFEKVENTPDLDRYVDFYKWVDSALNVMLQQLVPMSADISDEVRTMVESHVLERNKYQTKFPTLEMIPSDPETGIRGINELLYNWKYGHAPISGAFAPSPQDENCFWWKERAERSGPYPYASGPVLSSSDAGANNSRDKILSTSLSALNRSYSTPYKLVVDETPTIHGGVSYFRGKKIDYVKSSIKFGTTTGVTIGEVQSLKDCTDVYDPFKKSKLSFKATTNDHSYFSGKGELFSPLSLYSSSLYNDVITGSRITNLHSDTYGEDKDVPMQGPFTEYAVGGLQSRHVATFAPGRSIFTESFTSQSAFTDNRGLDPSLWKMSAVSTEYPEYYTGLRSSSADGNWIARLAGPTRQDVGFTNLSALNLSRSNDDMLIVEAPSWNSGSVDQLGGVNDPQGGYSIAMWLSCSDSGLDQYIYSACDNNMFLYQENADNRLYVGEQGGTWSGPRWKTTSGIPDFAGMWHHVVWSHKVSTGSGSPHYEDPELYIDAALVPLDEQFAPNGPWYAPTGSDFYLGNRGTYSGNPPGGRTFTGSIDEFAIWNRALSQEEVSEIYNSACTIDLGMGLTSSDSPGPISWYRMGDTPGDTDGFGGVIIDAAGRNNLICSGTSGTVGPLFTSNVPPPCSPGGTFDFTASGPVNPTYWTVLNSDTSIKYDTTASAYALCLSGSRVNTGNTCDPDGTSSCNSRAAQLISRYSGSLTIAYEYLAGTSPPYDPAGLDLNRPEVGASEALRLQYSLDETTWEDIVIHDAADVTNGEWIPHTAHLPASSLHRSAYLRWFQKDGHANNDDWAVKNIHLTTRNPRFIETVKTYEAPLTITFNYAQGDFQNTSSDGYNLEKPDNKDEELKFLYSFGNTNDWKIASSFLPSDSRQGYFQTHSVTFDGSEFPFPGTRLKFRWQQNAGYPAGDNWGLDNVIINAGTERPEGWKLENNKFTFPDADKPHAPYYREPMAKRPVNIANIKVNSLGNYSKNYEIVQTAGRYVNNRAWAVSGGWDLEPEGTPSYWIAGLMDVPKIQRGRHSHIFVNRFAAPGGPEVAGDSNGGPGLDRYSAEFSPYNETNQRNLPLRKIENIFLTSHVNQFGYFSNTGDLIDAGSSSVNPFDYAGTGSVYKTNRNTRRRLELSASVEITGSVYDNYWISHPIPQSDLQYAWITASVADYTTDALGYWDAGTFSSNVRESLVFAESFSSTIDSDVWLTASLIGTSEQAFGAIAMKSSSATDNWMARFGNWNQTASSYTTNGLSTRSLQLTTDFEAPLRIEYKYARGNYQANLGNTSRRYAQFDGTALLSCSAGTNMSSSTGLETLSFWIKADRTPSETEIYFDTWPVSGNSLDDYGRQLKMRTYDGLSYSRNYNIPGDPWANYRYWASKVSQTELDGLWNDGDWNHVAIVEDASNPAEPAYIYINGQPATITTAGVPLAGSKAVEDHFGAFMGTSLILNYSEASMISHYGNLRGCTGSIDSISWFNITCSAEQISQLYNGGYPGNVADVDFWISSPGSGNVNHYYQVGDACASSRYPGDFVTTANTQQWFVSDPDPSVEPVTPTCFDYNGLGLSNQMTMSLWSYDTSSIAAIGMEFREFPGFNMDVPEESEPLIFQYSFDSGVTWTTQETLTKNTTTAGDTAGPQDSTHVWLSDHPTMRFRWIQENFNKCGAFDCWAIDNVKITEIRNVPVVAWSDYGDFWSRIWSVDPNIKFGTPIGEIENNSHYTATLPTVYNGLNYNVYEPIDSDSQFLGYPVDNTYHLTPEGGGDPGDTGSAIQYLNKHTSPDGFANYSSIHKRSIASLTNAILLKRNGPYGYPSWKQIRTGEHPLARYYRDNNIITVTEEPGPTAYLDGTQYIPPFGATKHYREPAVNSNYQDIEFKLGMRVTSYPRNKDPFYVIRPVTIKTSYGNNLSYFNHTGLNRFAKMNTISPSTENQSYDVIKDLYLNGELNTVESPVYSFISLKYNEYVYPAASNTYTGRNRTRPDYVETFWRDRRWSGYYMLWSTAENPSGSYFPFPPVFSPTSASKSPRDILGSTKKFDGGFNSQGIHRTQSAWPLDCGLGYVDWQVWFPSVPYSYKWTSAGELQNEYTMITYPLVAGGETSSATMVHPAPMYARPMDQLSIYSTVNVNGNETINTYVTKTGSWVPMYGLDDSGAGPLGGSTTYFGGWGQADWQAGDLAGRVVDNAFVSASSAPFDDNYDIFREQLRLKNKEYSIVPEFRISEHMEFYINGAGITETDEAGSSQFLAENPKFLSIFGTTIDSSDDDFYETYSYSDFMKFFEIIDNDHEEMSVLEKTLTLRCKALKKFLPYDGFYPAERTLQLAQELSRSYAPYLTSSGDYEFAQTDQKMRPFLQPLVCPGILYNTIKSGIGVDYPIHTSSFEIVKYYSSSSVDGAIQITNYRAIGTASGWDPDSSRGAGQTAWGHRVPFETLLNPDELNEINLVDMEVNTAFKFTGSSTGEDEVSLTSVLNAPNTKNLYKHGIQNFLAGTIGFFLKGGSLSSFSSDVQPQPSADAPAGFRVESGSYGMRVRLRRSMNRDRISPSNNFMLAQDNWAQEDLHETITMYSRPSAFGPPVAGTNCFLLQSQSYMDPDLTSISRRQNNSDSLFGKNPAYTPPYYDGEAWMDITISASEGTVMTLDDIFNSAEITMHRIQQGVEAGWPNTTPLETTSLTPDTTMSGNYPYNRKQVWKFNMDLDSCINPFQKRYVESIDNQGGNVLAPQWVIQTKMETPILNFGDKTARPLVYKTGSVVNYIPSAPGGPGVGAPPQYLVNSPLNPGNVHVLPGGTATPIGMWHQFGLIPQTPPSGSPEGIHLSIEDIPQPFLNTRSTESANYPSATEMKSLIDVVGFTKNESRKLGSLRERKRVYEAVVAVPYIIRDGERKFIKIQKKWINRALKELEVPGSTKYPPGASIINMVAKMKKYIFPPLFDFVQNPKNQLGPIAMYIFEFSHTFDKDDLSYMWQNLMPRDSTSFQESTAELSNKLVSREILEKYKHQMKWMVFKVKQRGNNNYYSKIIGKVQSKDKKDKLQEPYSYNWPYDYFSIVEFIKMNSEITYSVEDSISVTDSFAEVNKLLKKGIQATIPLPPTPDKITSGTGDTTKSSTMTVAKMVVDSLEGTFLDGSDEANAATDTIDEGDTD